MREVLFEIPVYRVDPETWQAEVDAWVGKAMQGFDRAYPESSQQSRRDTEIRAYRTFTSDLTEIYNDVMGWVRVEWDGPGPVVKGYGYRVHQKSIRRGFEQRYEYHDKILECWFHAGQTSEEMAGELRQDLVDLTRRGEMFAGRHIDLDAFDSLAPYVDWPRLIGL